MLLTSMIYPSPSSIFLAIYGDPWVADGAENPDQDLLLATRSSDPWGLPFTELEASTY